MNDKVDVAQAEAELKSQKAVESENALKNIETEKRTLEEKLASATAHQGDVEKVSRSLDGCVLFVKRWFCQHDAVAL